MTKQLAILIALAAGGMQAQTAVARIPFAFKVGTVEKPAGEYSFSNTNGIIRVMPADLRGTGAFVFAANEDRPVDVGNGGGLEFQRYGDHYHLSKLWSEGRQGLSVEMDVDRADRAHLERSRFVIIALPKR